MKSCSIVPGSVKGKTVWQGWSPHKEALKWALNVEPKLQERCQDVGDVMTMECVPRQAGGIEWSWYENFYICYRLQRWRSMGIWTFRSPDDLSTSSRCQAQSCQIWCFSRFGSCFDLIIPCFAPILPFWIWMFILCHCILEALNLFVFYSS